MRYLFLLFLMVLSLSVLSQKYNFRYFGADEGLPQQSVLSLMSDQDGVLRIGTQGGFSMFDGQKFYNLSQKDGLNSNHVTSIYQDYQGDFWLGHRYDAPTFVSEDTIMALKGGWSDSIRSSTLGITRCGDKVWFVTEKEGLFYYDLNERSVLPYENKKLNDVTVKSLLALEDQLLIGTNRGLFAEKNNSLDKISKNSIDEINVLSMKSGKEGRNELYILSTHELIKTVFAENRVTSIETLISRQQTNLNSWEDFIVVSQDEFWIHSVDGALNLEADQSTLYTSQNGLGIDHVESMVVDREGNVWFGLYGQGLYQLLGDDFIQIDKSIGLIDNKVTGISTYKNEAWVSTEEGVSRIYYQSSKKLKIKSIVYYSSDEELIDKEVYSIDSDDLGNFYLSSMNGVVYFNRAKDRFYKYKSAKYGLTTFNINLELDQEGNVWLGSLGNGISKFKIDTKGVPVDIEKFNTGNGFFSDEIWKIFCDSHGRIWIGSNDQGLAKYEQGEFQYYGVEDGLTNERPGSITEDSKGNIWLGTIGGGVYKLDGKTFKNFNSEDGIQADNPYFVAADDLGNIWIGSNKGVDRLDIFSEEIDFFGKSQGFKGVETNQNAFHKDENGTMWFGTIGGVMQCFPARIEPSKTPPLVFIEGLRIYLKKRDLLKGVALSHDENHVTFDFNGIHYGSPEDVEFSFKLEGFDSNWSPVSKEDAATYSNLPPGTYEFKVKAKNRSDVWSEPDVFPIQITPPFWVTWWFRVLVTVTLVSIILIVFRVRTKKLRKQRELLRKQVDERTQELRTEKDKVQQFNQKLSVQNELLAVKNKDITDSIRYAERIQNGMLPGDREVEAVVPNSFIMYLPRDIVSGDFYWCMEREDIACFAAIDCTGHGVPGAFMSLIGNDLLNQVTNDPALNSTGNLLTAMHKKLKNYFLKEGGVNLNDGMDMALCAIKPNGILEFSGARRPLYLVRNNEAQVIKGDRFSIGESVEGEVSFTTHEISLEKDDMIYIFSDGFQDQFGGKNGKKFMVKQLRSLLQEHADKTVDEQHRILMEIFNAWKGTHEQVDDVLVWGIKI